MINIENFRRGNEYQFPEHFKRENKKIQTTLGYFVQGLKKTQNKQTHKKEKRKTKQNHPPKKRNDIQMLGTIISANQCFCRKQVK